MALNLIHSAKLIKQGAEARVYIATVNPADPPIILKHRFSKKYRHAALDASITRLRVGAEARAILRCLRSGINVPGIRLVDVKEGLLGLELIDGKSVRQIVPGATDDEDFEEGEELEGEEYPEPVDPIQEFGVTIENIMDMMGEEIAKMHGINIIHGDLTTSNMMLRRRAFPSPTSEHPSEILLIDFGLTSTSALAEDKAVDLYVLERAFASTHPDSEPLFARVLDAYARQSGKAWTPISRKLDEVRLRGRKRSMVG